jgi:hypothetical protein
MSDTHTYSAHGRRALIEIHAGTEPFCQFHVTSEMGTQENSCSIFALVHMLSKHIYLGV